MLCIVYQNVQGLPRGNEAKASTERRSIRSSVSTIAPGMAVRALVAFAWSRPGTTTLAPAERRVRVRRATRPGAHPVPEITTRNCA